MKPSRKLAQNGLSILTSTYEPANNQSAENEQLLMLFIPGYACRATDYEEVISHLTDSIISTKSSKTFKFVAIDPPGYGETPPSVCDNPDIEKFAKLINGIKKEFSSPKTQVVLSGHSLGCRMALEAFRQETNQVKGLIFFDGSVKNLLTRDKDSIPVKQEVKPVELPGGVRAPSAWETEEYMRMNFETMFSRHTPEAFKKLAIDDALKSRVYLMPLRRSVFQWQLTSLSDSLDLAGSKQIATLILQSTEGTEMNRRPMRKGEETAWMQLVHERVGKPYTGLVFEDLGHFPHIERPADLAEAIWSWLQTSIK